MNSFSDGMPGFVYQAPAEEGTNAWKRDVAITWAIDHQKVNKTCVVKIPNYRGYEIGYLAISTDAHGSNYFRVDEIEQPKDDDA